MCLVDCEQRDIGLVQHRKAARRDQTFGGYVKQVKIAGAQPPFHLVGFFPRQRGIEHCSIDAEFEQACDLIAHQGDQRRHHNAAAFAQQGGELVA